MKSWSRRRTPLYCACLLACAVATQAGTVEALRQDVEALASAEMGGRMTGTAGEARAAEYIEQRLEALGLRPLPGLGGYAQPFEFTAGTRDTGSTLSLTGETEAARRGWSNGEQLQALSFSGEGRFVGSVVFAGYGIVVPDSREHPYDSYVGLDVKDKIVLVLRYFPEDASDALRTELAQYSGLRYKALAARERGARALLVLTGPRSPNAGKTVEASFDAAIAGSGILAASIGGEIGETIMRRAGKAVEEVQSSLDDANPHAGGFELRGVELALEIRIERELREGHNILAYLPASAERPDARPGEYTVLGAHYDHLGIGNHGSSLAGKAEAGQVHHGADDNASGVAALLQVAGQLFERPRKRPVVFAFWSGEEIGLLGSTAFVKQPPFPIEQVVAYVNMDMVGRVIEGRLNLQGAGSSPNWPALIEQANVPVGLDLQVQQDPYLPTDSQVFYRAGIPTLSLFSGSHTDYHRPSDVASKLNYEGIDEVVSFASALLRRLDRLDSPPEYREVERPKGREGNRDAVRAYTGTIPDYATEVTGLRLAGVIAGGPADAAGLAEGDIIVEFNGKSITNIYDYTYALESVKLDQAVKVVYERGAARLATTIVPTVRP